MGGDRDSHVRSRTIQASFHCILKGLLSCPAVVLYAAWLQAWPTQAELKHTKTFSFP
jgi:hypothetical protein